MAPYKHKPIPRSTRGWAKEVEGIHRFLTELRKTPTRDLPGWKAKMGRYYRFRLDVLMEHMPRNVIEVRRGHVIIRERAKSARNNGGSPK